MMISLSITLTGLIICLLSFTKVPNKERLYTEQNQWLSGIAIMFLGVTLTII